MHQRHCLLAGLFISLVSLISFVLGGEETEVRIVRSWQVDHPVSTGVLSALAFGLWPSEFGSDAETAKGGLSMNAGYGEQAYVYVKRGAEPIFRNSRLLVWILLSILAVLLGFKFRGAGGRKEP